MCAGVTGGQTCALPSATLLLSQGTPMILMGDELGRSQAGNNNAYCQDNDLSWLQWDKVSDRDRAFRDFVEGLIRVRRTWSTLRRSSFMHGQQDRKSTRLHSSH